MKPLLTYIFQFSLILSGISVASAQAHSAENPFNQTMLSKLSESLQQDLEKGNIEWAQLHAIQLQLALVGTTSAEDSAKHTTSTISGTAETETLRSKFLNLLKSKSLAILENDPAATESLIPSASEVRGEIEEFNWSHSAEDLNRLSSEINKLYGRQLSAHLQASIDNASSYDGFDAYFKLTVNLADSLRAGSIASAATIAPEVLAEAPHFPVITRTDGQDIHNAYDALGRAAFLRGDYGSAAQYLLEAGKSPGSPVLGSFGPNLWLAKSLLDRGYTNTVITFLDSCKSFWKEPVLDEWIEEIKGGKSPSLLPNSKPSWGT